MKLFHNYHDIHLTLEVSNQSVATPLQCAPLAEAGGYVRRPPTREPPDVCHSGRATRPPRPLAEFINTILYISEFLLLLF